MFRRSALTALAFGLAAPVASHADVIKFDVSGAFETLATAINAAGVVAGEYRVHRTSCRQSCGYVRDTDGTITTFAVPGMRSMNVHDINGSGAIAGQFEKDRHTSGYIRAPGGTITAVDFADKATTIWAINDSGFSTGSISSNDDSTGFLRAPDGTLTTFTVADCAITEPLDLNASSTVVGACRATGATVNHTFTRTSDGTETVFDPPEAANGSYAQSIDDDGDVSGAFLDASNIVHGFLRMANGDVTTIDVPGAVSVLTCRIAETGDGVMLAGTYVDADQHIQAYVRRADGRIRTFDFSKGTPALTGTYADAINTTGVVVGEYSSGRKVHAFIRTP
jgi:hypothetical protein